MSAPEEYHGDTICLWCHKCVRFREIWPNLARALGCFEWQLAYISGRVQMGFKFGTYGSFKFVKKGFKFGTYGCKWALSSSRMSRTCGSTFSLLQFGGTFCEFSDAS